MPAETQVTADVCSNIFRAYAGVTFLQGQDLVGFAVDCRLLCDEQNHGARNLCASDKSYGKILWEKLVRRSAHDHHLENKTARKL